VPGNAILPNGVPSLPKAPEARQILAQCVSAGIEPPQPSPSPGGATDDSRPPSPASIMATPQTGATDARTPGFRSPRARTSLRNHAARKRRADSVGRDGSAGHASGDGRRPPLRPLFRKDCARCVGCHSRGIPEASRESREGLAASAEREAIRLQRKAQYPGTKNRNPAHPAETYSSSHCFKTTDRQSMSVILPKASIFCPCFNIKTRSLHFSSKRKSIITGFLSPFFS
jgi:hypothetical protein